MRVVINDLGGSIMAHAIAGQHYAAIGAKLAVIYCASACLNMLAMVPKENVCFWPDAWIGYHSEHQHPDELGRCCVESPVTMRWERGRDWIHRGYKECVK